MNASTPGPAILFVEDEALIAMATEASLEEAGYVVFHVASGEQAIANVESEPTKFAAVLTDIRLGDSVNGWQVAKRARELNPSIPVVFFSGAS